MQTSDHKRIDGEDERKGEAIKRRGEEVKDHTKFGRNWRLKIPGKKICCSFPRHRLEFDRQINR